MIFESFSTYDTENFAQKLAEKSKSGDIYCLNGQLGVGKTAFAKGFAKGLNIDSHITSPTFTILNEYNCGTLPFYHFDVYRIDDLLQMNDIGYEDYFYGNGVCLIEWSTLISDLIPNYSIDINIETNFEIDANYRKITVRGLRNEDFSN